MLVPCSSPMNKTRRNSSDMIMSVPLSDDLRAAVTPPPPPEQKQKAIVHLNDILLSINVFALYWSICSEEYAAHELRPSPTLLSCVCVRPTNRNIRIHPGCPPANARPASVSGTFQIRREGDVAGRPPTSDGPGQVLLRGRVRQARERERHEPHVVGTGSPPSGPGGARRRSRRRRRGTRAVRGGGHGRLALQECRDRPQACGGFVCAHSAAAVELFVGVFVRRRSE